MIEQVSAAQEQKLNTLASSQSLGQDVFLNLLVTQLKNQDPLEPMEGTEFVTQLAQFSELDEMRELTDGQEALQGYLASLNNFSAVSLLGKEVEFTGNGLTLQEGGTADIEFQLPADATKVAVAIYDENGNTVRSWTEGAMDAGRQSLVWNGQDDAGQQVAPGAYSFSITALDGEGAPLTVEQIQTGRVEKVEFQDGNPYLRIGDRWFALADIQSIGAPASL